MAVSTLPRGHVCRIWSAALPGDPREALQREFAGSACKCAYRVPPHGRDTWGGLERRHQLQDTRIHQFQPKLRRIIVSSPFRGLRRKRPGEAQAIILLAELLHKIEGARWRRRIHDYRQRKRQTKSSAQPYAARLGL